ncbi:hypothetical protein [Actinoplanes cyaneus]|uniref:hypothetical protein n=1 Tax=Actinoplanes cyaneus TaxID=52696 RepID=UPI002226BB93|nr:hypothetical protein [Actinoplanes cyaneus]
MSDDEGGPAFGFGAGGRPLWSVRDKTAEDIRALLRRAGHRELGDQRGWTGQLPPTCDCGLCVRPSVI